MKYVKWILVLLMVLVLPSLLPDCSCAYYSSDIDYENMKFEPHSFAPRCFISRFVWPEGQKSMILRIPDEVDGKKVTGMGGFIGSGAPAPFSADIPESIMVYTKDTLPEDAVVEQYHLTIVLGKYIRDTNAVWMDEYHHMGENRFIQILVTVDLGENTYFGVQDGKLYCKADGEIVEGFFYASDYINQ